MNSQEYRNLQEAYLDVYQEVDEATAMAKRGLNEPAIRQQIASKTGGGSFADKAGKLADRETYGNEKVKAGRENLARKQRGDFRDTTSSDPGLRGYGHKATTDADKAKQSARGAQRSALTPNEKKQLNREELSLDERVLGQDPEMRRARTKDEKRLPPSSGKEYAANQKKSISYMDKLTKNNKIIPGMAHESYDQQLDEISIGMKRRAADASVDKVKKAGERFRSSTSVDVQPYLRKKLDSAEAQHLRLAKAAESYEPDLFDVILEYLITEGYADTNENALVIMANMSEDWRQSIVNEGKSSRPRYPGGRGVLDQETRDEKREASAENMRGHTEGPGTVTKNPKKLRKQSAMNEFGR